ncbi:head-tail connector protein [Bacillus sp. ISL-46]|uniref:head-tail connector protein n=1 Tax=Bacillus sp. ISL-46 TaxID=2819129 RepID=UPI001BEAE413|nr:head-tail connector protein [Bacillus sp. ISL-46]MBT2722311.1 DNA-packaging protein [Bacillus sp. ISL-46]
MLDKIRKSLRITHNALDDEIQDLIDGAILDLQLSGVKKTDSDDPLIIRAVTTYCKANFGFDNPDSEKLNQAYTSLKIHLSLAGDYNVVS